jgi:hypothetical protein
MKNVTLLIIFFVFINISFGQKPKANVETTSGVKSFYLDEIYEATFEDSLGNLRLKFKKFNSEFQSIPLAEIERISFSPFGLIDFPFVIKYNQGASDSISLNDIEFLKFDNKSSVNNISINSKFTCYPNPVVSGKVLFEFPEVYIRNIEIFSIEGIKICELKEDISETTTSVVWECKNQFGIDVVPGIYLCRALFGNEVEYLKIIITR